MKNLIIEYKSVMLYRILIIIFTFSLVSAQSLFNRWNGSNSFVGSARSTSMGETHLLNSSGSSQTRFNPSSLSVNGKLIGINFQVNSTSIRERWSMPVRDSFGEFLTNADYVANEFNYYNVSGGLMGAINIAKKHTLGLGFNYAPLTNFTYRYSEEVRGSYSIEDGEYASKDPIVGYQNLNSEGGLMLTSIGSSFKLNLYENNYISLGFANNITLPATLKDKVEVDTLYSDVTNLTAMPDINANYEIPSSSFLTFSSIMKLNSKINIGISFEQSAHIKLNQENIAIDSSSGLYLFWDNNNFTINGLNYIKPEISSFGISYKSDHNKPMSIDFEINNLSYKNHLNLLDTKYYKFGFEYITQMGTPIRGGLIYKKMSLPSIDPISIFTFGTGKKISNVIIDFSGTYHMQTFSYPDLFVVEGDIRNTYDSVRDSQLNFQLGITYLY